MRFVLFSLNYRILFILYLTRLGLKISSEKLDFGKGKNDGFNGGFGRSNNNH